MISRLKPYPSYKDSGVEWLGRIPAQWSVLRSDAVLEYQKIQARRESFAGKRVFHYSIPAIQETGDGREEDGAEIDSDKISLSGDELLVSKLNPRKGCVLISKRQELPVICSTEFVPLRAKRCDLRFAFYLYASQPVRELISATVQSVTRSHQRANPADIAKIWLAFPSADEQHSIAAFLDRETGKSDALVGKMERLIELLQEKRTALISHAVTQGLHPNAPKKDSRIPWLGHIPEHWHLKKIGFFTSVGNGSTPERGNVDYWDGGDYPWLNSSVVNEENVTESPDFVTAVALRECHLPIVNPGSVLVAITGEGKTRGKAAILQFEATINQHLAYITPDPKLANGNFLRAALASRYDVLRFLSEGGGSTKGALTCEQLKQFKIPLPTLHEQQSIVEHIDQETAKMDTLMAKVRTAIERLTEYRTALISAAVTGQIDVRGTV